MRRRWAILALFVTGLLRKPERTTFMSHHLARALLAILLISGCAAEVGSSSNGLEDSRRTDLAMRTFDASPACTPDRKCFSFDRYGRDLLRLGDVVSSLDDLHLCDVSQSPATCEPTATLAPEYDCDEGHEGGEAGCQCNTFVGCVQLAVDCGNMTE
jgi:hypothetical protein